MIKKGWLVICPAIVLFGMAAAQITLADPAPAQQSPAINQNNNNSSDQDDNDDYDNIDDFGQDQNEEQDIPLNPQKETAPVQAVPPPNTVPQQIPSPTMNTAPHPGDEGDEN